MRDRLLTYALAASVGVHLIVLGFMGRTSEARPIHPAELRPVQVEMVELPDEPAPPPVVEQRKPITPPPPDPGRKVNEPPSKPAPRPVRPTPNKETPPKVTKPVQQPKPSYPPRPVVTPGPTKTSSNNTGKPAGDPGSGLKFPPTGPGEGMGPSGNTRPGWVPGTGTGPGQGSGTDPGVGRPDPVPGATKGPGKDPAPPPPPPPDVRVRVCAKSGMLPGEHCEKTEVRAYRPGREPTSKCTICKPKHVNRLADRAKPELISGQKTPKYPASAREKGIEGSVTVEYTIDTKGNVVGVKVSSSSGSSDLDRAAVDAVKSRKFKPAVQGGIARNYRKRETFRFAIN